MRLTRWMTGLGVGALCAAGVIVAPGLQAQGSRAEVRETALSARAGIGTFTPASGDPKLAAMLARSSLPDSGFRFTPSERTGAGRAVTVAVRTRTTRTAGAPVAAISAPSVNLAPVAYNLGVSMGWKRFAAADAAKVDLVAPSVGRAAPVDLGLDRGGKRTAPARLQAVGETAANKPDALISDKQSYGYDLGGSYSVTRNLAVTAGIRYKADDQRLPRLTDNRRDSQAVYVGTAFRF